MIPASLVRTLAPYAIGAFFAASVIGGAFYLGLTWERDRQAAQRVEQRLETIDTVEDLENEAANDDDATLADSISDVQ